MVPTQGKIGPGEKWLEPSSDGIKGLEERN